VAEDLEFCLKCSHGLCFNDTKLLMSDFSLAEVAKFAGKDARTVRRWCEKGFFSGAWQTAGGHWRIRADRADMAAAMAMKAARGYSRKRTPRKLTLGGKPVPVEFLRRVEAMKAKMRRESESSLAVLRVLHAMPAELMPEGVMESPLLADAHITALAFVMAATGEFRPYAHQVAPSFGMGLRKFYRRYGKRLPEARLVALQFLGVGRGQLYVTRQDADGNTYAEGVCMPESATDEERRRWGAACRIAA
jgi:hypothetical protein